MRPRCAAIARDLLEEFGVAQNGDASPSHAVVVGNLRVATRETKYSFVPAQRSSYIPWKVRVVRRRVVCKYFYKYIMKM